MVGDFYFVQINKLLKAAQGDKALFNAIVNAPFYDKIRTTSIDLGIIVLLLVNKQTGMIDRVALSQTESAVGTVRMSEKPFHEIRIPLGHPENLIARAIETGKPQMVADWKYLFIPAMDPKAARFNQAGGGIEVSYVQPIKARGGGALIFSFYQISSNIGPEHHTFMDAYAAMVDAVLSYPARTTGPRPETAN